MPGEFSCLAVSPCSHFLTVWIRRGSDSIVCDLLVYLRPPRPALFKCWFVFSQRSGERPHFVPWQDYTCPDVAIHCDSRLPGFWAPPTAARVKGATWPKQRLSRLPTLQWQPAVEFSGKDNSSAEEVDLTHRSGICGRLSDEPITILSDAESEAADEEENDGASHGGEGIDDLRLVDTLPSVVHRRQTAPRSLYRADFEHIFQNSRR